VKPADSCLSVVEVAKRLSVSVKTVRRLITDGELPSVRIHTRLVVRESDLVAFISSL
jgi:excisionase family DNA binding protein